MIRIALVLALTFLGVQNTVAQIQNSGLILESLTNEISNQGAIAATFGYEFTVGSIDLEVFRLGYYDAGTPGLANPHDVGVWLLDGTLVGSATVPAGVTIANLQWQFVDVATPFNLLANTTYRIGGANDASNADNVGLLGTPTLNSAIASLTEHVNFPAEELGGNVNIGATLAFPNGNTSFFPLANAEFVEVSVVPEPSTFSLIAAGTLSLAFIRRRRRGV